MAPTTTKATTAPMRPPKVIGSIRKLSRVSFIELMSCPPSLPLTPRRRTPPPSTSTAPPRLVRGQAGNAAGGCARLGHADMEVHMGVGTSLFLIAVGAILDFGVHPTGNTHGIDVNTIGLILMVIGVIGLLLSLLFW